MPPMPRPATRPVTLTPRLSSTTIDGDREDGDGDEQADDADRAAEAAALLQPAGAMLDHAEDQLAHPEARPAASAAMTKKTSIVAATASGALRIAGDQPRRDRDHEPEPGAGEDAAEHGPPVDVGPDRCRRCARRAI